MAVHLNVMILRDSSIPNEIKIKSLKIRKTSYKYKYKIKGDHK